MTELTFSGEKYDEQTLKALRNPVLRCSIQLAPHTKFNVMSDILKWIPEFNNLWWKHKGFVMREGLPVTTELCLRFKLLYDKNKSKVR